MELELAAALLRQGSAFNALSRGMLLLAVGSLLLVSSGLAAASAVALAALVVSLLAGLLQIYFALRVGLDADLLCAVARASRGGGGDLGPATLALDAALHAHGLRSADRPVRDWPQRLAGARRLWRRQILALLVQLSALLGAVLLAFLGGAGAGFAS